MGAYDNDRRVERVSDNKFSLPYGWQAWFDPITGRWCADSARDQQCVGFFDTADEAICAVIGDPR